MQKLSDCCNDKPFQQSLDDAVDRMIKCRERNDEKAGLENTEVLCSVQQLLVPLMSGPYGGLTL